MTKPKPTIQQKIAARDEAFKNLMDASVEVTREKNAEIQKLTQERDALKEELRVIDRAVLIADRRAYGGESELMDASQEAAHYNWLDDQNRKLESALEEARSVIEFYGSKNNWNERWTDQGDGGDISDAICDSDVDFKMDGDTIIENFGGKRAREWLSKHGDKDGVRE